MRRNSADPTPLPSAPAARKASFAAAAMSSKLCATSTGEYFAFGQFASKSCACSTTVENICGSSGLTVPKHFGVGVSPYGDFSIPQIPPAC